MSRGGGGQGPLLSWEEVTRPVRERQERPFVGRCVLEQLDPEQMRGSSCPRYAAGPLAQERPAQAGDSGTRLCRLARPCHSRSLSFHTRQSVWTNQQTARYRVSSAPLLPLWLDPKQKAAFVYILGCYGGPSSSAGMTCERPPSACPSRFCPASRVLVLARVPQGADLGHLPTSLKWPVHQLHPAPPHISAFSPQGRLVGDAVERGRH